MNLDSLYQSIKYMLKQIEYITTIQNIFSIFNKDLAYILDEDRSIVFSYSNGKKVSYIVLLKLERLADIAISIKPLNIERIDSFLYREVVNGQTLIDFLKDCTKVDFVDFHKYIEFIDSIKRLSDKEAATRKRDRSISKNARSLQDVMNEYSTLINYD